MTDAARLLDEIAAIAAEAVAVEPAQVVTVTPSPDGSGRKRLTLAASRRAMVVDLMGAERQYLARLLAPELLVRPHPAASAN